MEAEPSWRLTVLRFLQAGVLCVWSVVLLYFSFSDRVGSYLHPSFHGPLLVTGIILGVLAFIVLVHRDAVWCCGDPGCPEQPPSLLTASGAALVLVLPLLIGAVASPSQFGATAIRNRGIVSSLDQLPALGSLGGSAALPGASGAEPWANDPAMDSAGYLARTPEGRIRAETIDLLFAAQEPPLQSDFAGKAIEILGQYLPKDAAGTRPDRFHLIRIFILCCAADGRPLGITVELPPGMSLPDLPEMTWVRVRGVARFPVEGGRQIPLVQAESVEEVEPPAETFLY